MTNTHGGPGVAQWLRTVAATAETGRLSGCEVATLFSMLVFANWRTGDCWPTVARLARVSRRSERATQRAIGELVSLGLVKVPEARRGGRRGKGTMYRLDFAALARMATGATSAPETGDMGAPVTADHGGPGEYQPGMQGGTPATPTGATSAPVTGANGGPDGCQASPQGVTNATVTGDKVAPKPTREQPIHHHQVEPAAVADVFTRFGIEHLRGHQHATPGRMSWIERVAPTKDKPGGWAADCIRKAYAVPPPTEAEVKARRKARREAALARFDAMPEPKRRAVLARVREKFSNLDSEPDDTRAVRGAIAQIMDPDARQADRGVNKD